jgi:hypothetical protein
VARRAPHPHSLFTPHTQRYDHGLLHCCHTVAIGMSINIPVVLVLGVGGHHDARALAARLGKHRLDCVEGEGGP